MLSTGAPSCSKMVPLMPQLYTGHVHSCPITEIYGLQYIYMYMYIYICIYICIYTYVYIYYKMLLHHWLDPCRVAAAESVQPRWLPRPGEKTQGMGDQWDTLWLCQNSYGKWPFSSLIYPLKIVDLSIVMGLFTRGYRLNMNGIYICIYIWISHLYLEYSYIDGYQLILTWMEYEWNINGIWLKWILYWLISSSIAICTWAVSEIASSW